MTQEKLYILDFAIGVRAADIHPATDLDITIHKLKGCKHTQHWEMKGSPALVYLEPYKRSTTAYHCVCAICDRKMRTWE